MQTLPDFHFKAVRSARVVTPDALRGMPALLLFHNHLTIDAARAVQEAVRRDYQPATQPFIASIVDLAAVPALMRPMASSAMSMGYGQAATMLPAGLNPEDYIVILPDWSGKVTQACGVSGVGRQPALLFVDPEGVIQARYQGDEPGEAALEMLISQAVPPVSLPGFPQV